MSASVLYMSMSLDGFIADPNDNTGSLFDWFSSGDTEIVSTHGKFTVEPMMNWDESAQSLR